MTLGHQIRQRRQELNLSQEELAARIGLSQAHISRVEGGVSLSLATLERICLALSLELCIQPVSTASAA